MPLAFSRGRIHPRCRPGKSCYLTPLTQFMVDRETLETSTDGSLPSPWSAALWDSLLRTNSWQSVSETFRPRRSRQAWEALQETREQSSFASSLMTLPSPSLIAICRAATTRAAYGQMKSTISSTTPSRRSQTAK